MTVSVIPVSYSRLPGAIVRNAVRPLFSRRSAGTTPRHAPACDHRFRVRPAVTYGP